MYQLSRAAARDIENILQHSVEQFGVQQTEVYYQSLQQCLELLVLNPDMGFACDEIKKGYYRFNHQSHVIFYRILSPGIFIIRLLHKSMDVERQFKEI